MLEKLKLAAAPGLDLSPGDPVAKWAVLRIAELEEGMRRVLDKYDEENPARTADYHLSGCDCMRCRVDDARATLTKST